MAELGPDVRLWVAGDGPQTPKLRAQTADDPRISWMGRISDDELASRLKGADVLCAPSLHGESFGVVLLEAMAAQHADRGVGPARLPQRGPARRRSRCWCAPGDPPALADGLRAP